MAVYNGLEKYITPDHGTAVALGFFDGVHLGHRAVISSASQAQLPCVVLTFSENPLRTLGRECPPILTDNSRKVELLTAAGADDVIFADFARIKDMTPEEFVKKILHDRQNAKKVFCGFNYRFGSGGAGDTEALKELCAAFGIGVTVCEPVALGDEQISSSMIRRLIADGEIARANSMLGYRYGISGVIGGGNHIGSELGFPTINIPMAVDMITPRKGVYASMITVGGKSYRGATNIGVHPTVGANDSPLCESFLIDFPGGDLYGSFAVCELCDFIREEQRFSSFDELTAQIKKDCDRIKTILS